MGWDSDREPLGYLERRLKYYKRRVQMFVKKQTGPPDQWFVNYCGGIRNYRKTIKRIVERYQLRVTQFTEAIEKIKK